MTLDPHPEWEARGEGSGIWLVAFHKDWKGEVLDWEQFGPRLGIVPVGRKLQTEGPAQLRG
jgi:hypothetical protein